jgi:uncharacterized Tic20 family protein
VDSVEIMSVGLSVCSDECSPLFVALKNFAIVLPCSIVVILLSSLVSVVELLSSSSITLKLSAATIQCAEKTMLLSRILRSVGFVEMVLALVRLSGGKRSRWPIELKRPCHRLVSFAL